MPVLPPRALLMAPMVELSHRPLRELVASFGGCDRYYTEMTSAAGYLSGAPWDKYFMDPEPEPARTVVQFYGNDARSLAGAASKLAADRRAAGGPLGGIDVNFGCSAPHIEKAGGGVSWMKDPDGARGLLAGVVAAADGVPVSVKIRLGYDESPEALLGFCRGLCDAGAAYIVLHPRLKSEKFRRTGKWRYVRLLADALPVPVIGNGDVRSPADYAAAVGDYSHAGVMVGREAARRPWIFALIRAVERDPAFSMEVRIEETGLRMLSLLRAYLPQPFMLSRARRFFFYYCDNLAFAHHIRYRIQNAPDIEAVEARWREYFREVPGDRIKTQRGP